MAFPAEKRYKAKAYDVITVNFPKGSKVLLANKCTQEGISVQKKINELVRDYLELTPEQWTYKYFQQSGE